VAAGGVGCADVHVSLLVLEVQQCRAGCRAPDLVHRFCGYPCGAPAVKPRQAAWMLAVKGTASSRGSVRPMRRFGCPRRRSACPPILWISLWAAPVEPAPGRMDAGCQGGCVIARQCAPGQSRTRRCAACPPILWISLWAGPGEPAPARMDARCQGGCVIARQCAVQSPVRQVFAPGRRSMSPVRAFTAPQTTGQGWRSGRPERATMASPATCARASRSSSSISVAR